MSDKKKSINESYIPRTTEKSYQPVIKPRPRPETSYVPITDNGNSPTNRPIPPGDK